MIGDSPMELLNFIDGTFTKPIGGQYIESVNPSTGTPFYKLPASGLADVEAAVSAAKKSLKTWSKTTVEERSKILFKIADLIEADMQKFAEAESKDQGKTLKQALTIEIPRAIQNFRYFAGAINHLSDQSSAMAECQSFTIRSPVGVVGLISPWNLPLYLLTWKIAPAIAMGNCVVAKPSEMTSLTAFMLCEVLQKAGLPAGVVNIVFGLGNSAGAAIVSHPDVRAISFTGGTATGREIQELAAAHNKKISLELGGKNANIIFADCDLEKAIFTSIRSSFANQGEICLCGSRILVEEAVYEKFLEGFIAETAKLKVGDPFDSDTFMGALNSKAHLEKVQSYIDLAKSEGCDVISPATVSNNVQGGYFIPPTIILKAQRTSRLMMEEIFGPVVCIVPFKDEEDAISLANSTEYGLSASVWTKDLSRAHRLARELQVGTVWINCWMLRDLSMPFGGVKASGIGREGGKYSLEFYSEVKTVTMAI